MGPEWLPRLEATSNAYPREGAVALAVGCALAERQLWGKARRLLARLAEEQADAERAAQCYAAAAKLG